MKKKEGLSVNRARQETIRKKVRERNLPQEMEVKRNMLPGEQRKK